MDKVFSYDLDNERQMRITYKDFLFKWEVDIIENPEAHFKAEDQRRFGVYNYYYQSINQMTNDPWHQDIPQKIHKKIVKYIEEELDDVDRELSDEEVKGIKYSVWAPL